MPRPLAALFAALALAARGSAADPGKDGFAPLFNGTDLAGWVNVNCHPGTFFVKGNEIVTTGRPTGYLRTAKQYENFVLEMEWMHVEKTKPANSGLFVWGDPLPAVGTGYTRGIEVQILINYPDVGWATNHGDLFSIWGAHCTPDRPHPKGYERNLPSEERVKGGGEWNHYKVVATDGVLKLHVNGKEVSGVSKCTPRKGYLALESEGAECHFRNLRIKELPSTNPKPEDVAKADEGFKSLFTGLDLTGWETPKGAWTANDGVLRPAGTAPLRTAAELRHFELTFDWQLPAKGMVKELEVTVGRHSHFVTGKPGAWNRTVVTNTKAGLTFATAGQKSSAAVTPAAGAGPVAFTPAAGLELRNIFAREITEE